MPRGKSDRPRRRFVHHFSVLDKLDPRDHAALEVMLAGNKKIDARRILEWCAARGCPVHYGSLYRYRRYLMKRAKAARDADRSVGHEAELQVLYARLARDVDPLDCVGVSVAMCELLCFTTLRHISPDDVRHDPRLLFGYTAVVTAMTKARERFWFLRHGDKPGFRRRPGRRRE